jgi:hypothetical protein
MKGSCESFCLPGGRQMLKGFVFVGLVFCVALASGQDIEDHPRYIAHAEIIRADTTVTIHVQQFATGGAGLRWNPAKIRAHP